MGVDGLKAYIGSIFNRQTGLLILTRAYDVPAGTGLLLKGKPGTYTVPYRKSYSVTSNLLKGVMTPTAVSATEDGYVNYILSKGSQGNGFYKVGAAGAFLEAGSAYLQIPAEVALNRIRLRFNDEDEATAISDILQKDDEGALYELQGRCVENPVRGLYIRNGSKIVIR